jgi:hypothetical protein
MVLSRRILPRAIEPKRRRAPYDYQMDGSQFRSIRRVGRLPLALFYGCI